MSCPYQPGLQIQIEMYQATFFQAHLASPVLKKKKQLSLMTKLDPQ